MSVDVLELLELSVRSAIGVASERLGRIQSKAGRSFSAHCPVLVFLKELGGLNG